MKTTFKNLLPIAVVALAVSGAFVTTSMQSTSKLTAPKVGYPRDFMGNCILDQPQSCNTNPVPNLCYVGGGTSGTQAYGADQDCQEILYRNQ
ncbi:MAG: hypothetical protein J7574_14010 [Flavobacterium sp.]|uniref:DUF6520 family protein n=1 Tax=Flavobacterium sp. TaxID=239 RepID=UPI001B204B14|nr:DUF6520 family protein [Flavobacterium sp.]MBO9585273.1 hypothetical protein [Flavobacterium sp.]